MSGKSECFTFIWKVKNFSFLREPQFSPSIFVQAMSETKWKLRLIPKSFFSEDCVECYVYREYTDSGPELYVIDYELAFISNDGSAMHSEKYHQEVFKKHEFDSNTFYIERSELLKRKALFIPDDTLTICCKMWDGLKPILYTGRCFAETTIETERRTFIGIIKKFSSLESGGKNLVSFHSTATEPLLSSLNLCVANDGKLVIEMKLVVSENINMHICKIYIRDVFGNKVKSGQGEFHSTKLQSISLTLLKEHLIENKGIYLPNNILTLECDIVFPTLKKTEKIDDAEYGFDNEDTQNILCKLTKANLDSEKNLLQNLKILKNDFISLLKEDILCDTTLKTATEAFLAHSVILSARSPVFKSMFTIDMKENINKCVNIDDLDADTVRRMLLFMYSATLDDLQYESAKSLYFAADKYNIVSLKNVCSNFLKRNLSLFNCCDVLLLADKHQDTILKRAVQDYIAENDEAALISDEWQNLERNHSHLTIEIFHYIYKKLRRTQK